MVKTFTKGRIITKLPQKLLAAIIATWGFTLAVIELMKKEKTVLIMGLMVIISFIIAAISIYYGAYNSYSRHIYKTKFLHADTERAILQDNYRELENKYETLKKQTGMTYNYNTGNFDKFIPPVEYNINDRINWGNLTPPKINKDYYYTPQIETKTVYIETPTPSLKKYDSGYEDEERERRLMRLEGKMNNYELERDFRIFTGRSLYDY